MHDEGRTPRRMLSCVPLPGDGVRGFSYPDEDVSVDSEDHLLERAITGVAPLSNHEQRRDLGISSP
jgi:hypothetical protein